MIKRILVVDDESDSREIIRLMLESEGFQIVEAGSGSEAKQIILNNDGAPFDLILADILMPDLNGLDLLAWIKLNPSTKNTPVHLLTSQDRPECILEGYNAGADYYVTKPFTKKQLMFGLNLWEANLAA